MKNLGFAIIGCGGMGKKRAATVVGAKNVICADVRASAAIELADWVSHQGTFSGATTWEKAVCDPDVDVVVVSTPHDQLTMVSEAALAAGKHVLVEKPAGCRLTDIESLMQSQHGSGKFVRVGFNHRYHASILKAYELLSSLGMPMMVRGRYGHGGRLGYDKEWRAEPLRGGGELLDQGVHLIDLASLFLRDYFSRIDGYARTLYWNQLADDNAFMLLQTECGSVAHLHVSSTEWKNTFSLEIYGTKGKIHAEGLGGSYGTERLTYYRMLPEMGPPETTIWEFPGADKSWEREMNEFVQDIELNRDPSVGLEQARAAMRVVEALRENS